jgi:hypothetical protein
MTYIKFFSQKNDVPSIGDCFESIFKYAVDDSLEKIKLLSEIQQNIFIVKIPGRFDASWRSEYKDYDTDKAAFGIAINILKQKISKKISLLDKEEYAVGPSDSYNFSSNEFTGFHTNIIEV